MKHLTPEQRYTISVLFKRNVKQAEIAVIIGYSQATVSKELAKNKTKKGIYSAKIAQENANFRKQRFAKKRKFNPEIERFVKDKIEQEQWSPEQIVGYAKLHEMPMVSVERIYQFIRFDKKNGGNLHKFCRHKLKKRKKCVGAGVGHIPNRISIHQRPPQVSEREVFGHWEMDLITGDGKQDILTLVERKSRFMLMKKLKNGKNADDVKNAVFSLLFPYKKYVKTITTDNGGEFAKHLKINKLLSTTVYFTDPYSSCKRARLKILINLLGNICLRKQTLIILIIR